MKSKFHFNPMAEFMHENFEDNEVEEMFEEFKKTHGKSYIDPEEHEQRKHIFRHNMRSVRHLLYRQTFTKTFFSIREDNFVLKITTY